MNQKLTTKETPQDPVVVQSERDEKFLRLMAQHEHDLYRYVVSLIFDYSAADDIVQDAVVALWKRFDDYDPERPFFPWACRFAFLQVLKHRQKIARSRLVFNEDLVDKLAKDYETEHPALVARRDALQGCLKKLPSQDRELISTRYGSGDTIRAMARRTGGSVHKLYHSLERIRKLLMKCVNQTLIAEGWDEIT
jgi:RNA polymerase sigma-70 factor (ECF subfamily)